LYQSNQHRVLLAQNTEQLEIANQLLRRKGKVVCDDCLELLNSVAQSKAEPNFQYFQPNKQDDIFEPILEIMESDINTFVHGHAHVPL